MTSRSLVTDANTASVTSYGLSNEASTDGVTLATTLSDGTRPPASEQDGWHP